MNLSKHEQQEAKLAQKVTRAHSSGNRGELRAAVRDYLNSYSCRLVATRKAIETSSRRSHKSATEIARDMNVWEPCSEVAKVNVALKDVPPEAEQGGFCGIRARVTVAFGVENQARQMLVRKMLMAMWNTSPVQTMLNGGRTRAAKLVREHYAAGYQRVAEVDIHRCFRSFSKQGISQFLCLPEKVTENVLGASSLNLQPSLSCKKEALYHSPNMSCSPMELFMMKYGEDWDPARLGLIEGSRASPFVAELLLAPICRNLAERGAGRVVNYADNFLLMAQSNSEMRGLNNELRNGLHAHPAGPLQVNERQSPTKSGAPFEFLGYRFEPEGSHLNCIWGKKSENKARKIRRDGHRILKSDMPRPQKLRFFSKLENRHRALVDAFPEWPQRTEFHRMKMSALQSYIGR